ncbi:MAG: hypothetical protein IJQ31_16045 [Thermoguttaceae bacterium]|nr:hypothetical protein [Thermoguttaceae bacterium]
MKCDKSEWIAFFTKKVCGEKEKICLRFEDHKDQAREINKFINDVHDGLIQNLKDHSENMTQIELLNETLIITYASYIVMLDARNSVWPYENMDFARRIGELWEPFCKLPFEYPIRKLTIIDPPDFKMVQNTIKKDATDYIDGLNLDQETKNELKRHYSIPWTMVDSGGIKLGLDLHFEQDGIHYNCDFKSGFSSNEKGNTNRLLLVASIYNSLGEIERTLLFVRQTEDENNHYLQTLKNSPYWDVYCANNSYVAMQNFTGFDMRKWIDENIDWENDISNELRAHLEEKNLLRYLTW